MITPHTFAIDFDGTVAMHEWPKIGADVPLAVETMLEMANVNKHQLVLSTMRSGKELDEAVAWFADRKISLLGINKHPTQHEWTSSPKIYAQHYIGDDAIGVPLVVGKHARPYVDWEELRKILYHKYNLLECPYMR